MRGTQDRTRKRAKTRLIVDTALLDLPPVLRSRGHPDRDQDGVDELSDFRSGVDLAGRPRRTTAVPDFGSGTQTMESPGRSSRMATTGCGTVVFRDRDVLEGSNVEVSNSIGTTLGQRKKDRWKHKSGLSKGRLIDLILKYCRAHGSIDRPMAGTRGTWDTETDMKAIRLLSSRREAMRPEGRARFRVPSQSGTKPHQVYVDVGGWGCDCTSWAENRTPCVHILAVVHWLDPNPPPIAELDQGPARKSFPRDNPKYDQAQQLEHQVFDRYLWDLLGAVNERICETGHQGRPAIPLRTQILMATRKVHLSMSMRRARGLLIALNSDGKGLLARVPNYAVPSRFFGRPQAPAILLSLIERSALILKDIEDAGTVSIDSTGFCTTCRGAYCTEHYMPDRKHRWVKAHLAIGVKTHVVLTARITDEHGADYSEFEPLLQRVSDLGHTPSTVVADKAYLGRGNLTLAEALKINPYIPFKSNSRGLSHGSPIWNRKYHEFMARREEFDEIYHRRSNSESANSAIKRLVREDLFGKGQLSRMNELLAKILAYNVWVVVKQAHLHGIEPAAPPAISPGKPIGGDTGAALDREAAIRLRAPPPGAFGSTEVAA